MVRIRTVTLFSRLDIDEIKRSAQFFDIAKPKFESAGFEVQSCRISTETMPSPIDKKLLKALDSELQATGLIVNLGPLRDVSEISWILRETKNTFLSFNLREGDDLIQMQHLAALILQISREQGVSGSFRFCVSSQCPPFIPFFPTSYSVGEKELSFGVGVEWSDILSQCKVIKGQLDSVSEELKKNLEPVMQQIESICQAVSSESGVKYMHIDSSLCPALDCPPITEFWQKFGINNFGDPGTLAVCGATTRVLKELKVSLGGFSGVMLPVCEDRGLVKAAAEGSFKISDLLYYSTVCACGLDCIPVPGYTDNEEENRLTEQKIAVYLLDMHTIAARLLPVAGKKSRESTEFDFKYLIDGLVMDL